MYPQDWFVSLQDSIKPILGHLLSPSHKNSKGLLKLKNRNHFSTNVFLPIIPVVQLLIHVVE